MNHWHKLKIRSHPKWRSSSFPENHLRLSKTPFSQCLLSNYVAKNPIFYSTRAEIKVEDQSLDKKGIRVSRVVRSQIEAAQSALLEYLHGTRSLPFPDAEHISKHCPTVIDRLLKKVEGEEDIGWALTKLFRYHPINEFEPFFESIGLTSSEVNAILPRDLMFLKDDNLLLENYQCLRNYGISRSLIGKFYRNAVEIFRYGHGVLPSKLKAYEDLGLSQSSVIKVVGSNPSLLIGTVNGDFVKMLDLLKSSGIDFKWIEGRLSDKVLYDWGQMLGFLSFICQVGYSKEELGTLMKRNPGLIVESSGRISFRLVGILLKFGSTKKELSSLLLQFPRVQFGAFAENLRHCLLFLMQIEMDAKDIGNILQTHLVMLGSCSLKKSKSTLNLLNVGKKRLRNIIKEDPYQLKNWVRGRKLEPLPNTGARESSRIQRKVFLLNLGLTENSDEFKKALKSFKGKGGELQERFDCFLKAGLDREDLVKMILKSPQVLYQSKDAIECKIDYLVNGLRYPISNLLVFPSYVCYTIEKVKLRYSMYSWLRDRGLASPKLALSTIISCSDKCFISMYVTRHPKGLEVWENLKKEYCF